MRRVRVTKLLCALQWSVVLSVGVAVDVRADGKRYLVTNPYVAGLVAASAGTNCQIRVLCWENEASARHELTAWDVSTARDADVYFALGVPFEKELVERLRSNNPSLKVVRLDEKCSRLAGNPYFWAHSGNRTAIKSAVKQHFGDRSFCICGGPETMYLRIKPDEVDFRRHVVAIAHPAFEYECQRIGVHTVPIDPIRVRDDPAYAEAAAARLATNEVGRVLALPRDSVFLEDFARRIQAKVVSVDVLGGGDPVEAGMAIYLWCRFQKAEHEENERVRREEERVRGLSETEQYLHTMNIPSIRINRPVTMAQVAAYFQEMTVDYGRPDLTPEKRMVRFVCSKDVAQKVVPKQDDPDIENVYAYKMTTILDALSEICQHVNCTFKAADGVVHISNK